MKKLNLILVSFTIFVFKGSAQTWLNYSPVQDVSYLGKAVTSYDKLTRNITRNPAADPKFPVKIDTSKSASQSIEFVSSLREFSLPFYKKTRITLDSIYAANVLYQSVATESLQKLPQGQYYIYAGLTADSVVMVLKYDRSRNFGFGRLVDTMRSVLADIGLLKNPVAASIASGIVKLVEGGESKKGDSAYARIIINDKTVLYKVQAIMYTQLNQIGSKYIQHFVRGAYENPKILTNPGNNSISDILVPYSKDLKKMDKNSSFGVTLIYDRNPSKSDSLNIGLRYASSIDGSENTLFLERKMLSPAGRPPVYYWQQHGLLTDIYVAGKAIKRIYYDVYAIEGDPDPLTGGSTVKIFHEYNNSPTTYLKYPEIVAKWLK